MSVKSFIVQAPALTQMKQNPLNNVNNIWNTKLPFTMKFLVFKILIYVYVLFIFYHYLQLNICSSLR
jgi:hypothetical protein